VLGVPEADKPGPNGTPAAPPAAGLEPGLLPLFDGLHAIVEKATLAATIWMRMNGSSLALHLLHAAAVSIDHF
jgi:hypothetical protein